jgi:hypothetical protein
VNFATGANHPAGPQFNDSLCSTCHIPQGAIDFDASIKGAHVAPTASSLVTGWRYRRSVQLRSRRPVQPPIMATPVLAAT